MTDSVGGDEIAVPRTVARQTCRDNPPAANTTEYYRMSLFVPFDVKRPQFNLRGGGRGELSHGQWCGRHRGYRGNRQQNATYRPHYRGQMTMYGTQYRDNSVNSLGSVAADVMSERISVQLSAVLFMHENRAFCKLECPA